MLHRILTVSIPDPFFPSQNIKEKKVVWLARLALDSMSEIIKVIIKLYGQL